MSATAHTLRPPSRTLMWLEGRAIHELGAFLGALPLLSLAPRGDGHPVLVLPGLVASDTSTRPLRSFLKSRGYAASGWRQGRNLGPRDGVQHAAPYPPPAPLSMARSLGTFLAVRRRRAGHASGDRNVPNESWRRNGLRVR